MALFSLIWFFLISTPFIPEALLSVLENDDGSQLHLAYLGSSDTAYFGDVHILILGSGYGTDDRLSWNNQLSPSAITRLNEGIRLHRLMPGSMLVTSGYGNNQPLAQATVSAFAAKELGVDSTHILTIPEPWNTKDEAITYAKRYGTSHTLYLVTDAAHMRRSLMHFRNAGLHPIPAPSNFRLRINNIPKQFYHYFPSSQNIYFMEIVFHEYLGLLWMRMGGD
jgi:uncharacterized SAM-binding protein YcdF (DUF218 family)